MTNLQAMETFFFDIFDAVPDFLVSEPIIYFVSLIFGITIAALFFKIFFGGIRHE